jgi:hypothetical protein
MIGRFWSITIVATFSSLGVPIPSTAHGQDDPRGQQPASVQQPQHEGTQEDLQYDAKSEATLKGIVAEVKGGRSALYWFSRIHTLGLGHMRAPDPQLLLKTDTETVQIQLGPLAFLSDQKLEISEGDALEVTGSRVAVNDSHVVLAREIRKGSDAWTFRDATGQPLWSSTLTEGRGFWTKKKVLVAVVVTKVVLLATVLRH